MINPVIYPITLDVYKTGSQKVLSMVRGDTKRVISVALIENDKPYIITEGCTAIFTALKPDGNFIYNNCEIDFKNNTINYQVTDQTTAVNGIVACQIRLIGANGGILSAPSFTMVVSDLLYNEEPIVDSSNEFNALTRYIEDLQYKVNNGFFDGKSITIKGSVSDVSELDAKISHVVAGDGYIAGDDHLYVFDGTVFVDVGAVRGPQGLPGVYVGSGNMPDGYDIQIDPDGAAYEMDTELNASSKNPVANSAITKAIVQLQTHLNEPTITVEGATSREEKIKEVFRKLPDNTFARYCITDGSYVFFEIHKSIRGYGHMEKIEYLDRYVRDVKGGVMDENGKFISTFGEWRKLSMVTEPPEMHVGVEYALNEKYLGKTVYSKIVSVNVNEEVYNELTETCSLSVKHGIDNIEFVKSISAIKKDEYSSLDVASFSNNGFSVNEVNVDMIYSGMLFEGTIYIELKYTKKG